MTNQTSESLEVDCQEGFDGGQPQIFHLEVYDLASERLRANKSSGRPSFLVDGLGPGRVLRMIVYASNTKGRSDFYPIEGFTLKVAEKQTGELCITLTFRRSDSFSEGVRDSIGRVSAPGLCLAEHHGF